MSSCFGVYSGLPCQSGCNESSAEMEWNGQCSWKGCVSVHLFSCLLPVQGFSCSHKPGHFIFLTLSLVSICPSPACSLINIMIKNMMVIKYNTKQLLVTNWLNFYIPAPKAHIRGIPAYCDSSFKTSRDRNINPVKLLLIQNFTSPLRCYL